MYGRYFAEVIGNGTKAVITTVYLTIATIMDSGDNEYDKWFNWNQRDSIGIKSQ